MRKIYYIYDRVADNFIYFCEAPNDAVAQRAFVNSCENDFKAVADDLDLFCLGSLDNTGIIPDKTFVCKFNSLKGVHIND